MHGVSKTALSEEQKEAKRLERQKKLERFVKVRDRILNKAAAGEYDDEGLTIAGMVLSSNPDLYMFWNYRKRALLAMLQTDTNAVTANDALSPEPKSAITRDIGRYYNMELVLTEECLRDNPKSYGAWYHRQWVLQKFFHYSETSVENIFPKQAKEILKTELHHCGEGLKYDERNFHCWDHRRFLCELGSVSPAEELEFSKAKIDENFSNYSAWHYRSSLLPAVFPPTDKESSLRLEEQKIMEELSYVQNAFFTDPEDQSAWFYHWWLFRPAEESDRNQLRLTYFSFTSVEPSFIVLAFSRPVKITATSKFQVSVDETPVMANSWSTPDGASSSYVWTSYELSDETKRVLLRNDSSITIIFDGTTVGQFKVALDESGQRAEWSRDGADLATQLQPKLSPAFRGALENSMRSCRELKEVEPASNKWPLLTEILAMRWLDLLQYRSEIISGLQQLMASDSRKRNYYEDLKSTYTLEAKLLSISDRKPLRVLDLDGLGLTALPPMKTLTLLINVRELNLYNNRLTSTAPLGVLVNLVRLSADGNQFASTKGLDSLLHLEFLSLSSNRLGPTCSDALTPLKKCVNLRQLILNGNLFEKEITANDVVAFLDKSKNSLLVSL